MKRIKETKAKRNRGRRAQAKRLRHRGRRDQRGSQPRALRPEPEAKPEMISRQPIIEEEPVETPEVEVEESGPTAEEL